jgi:hypothetical protein
MNLGHLLAITLLRHTAMMKNAALFALAFALGCAVNKPTDLVVVGNSITRHGPAPSIDWSGDWGMAAPSSDKDFSHLVASRLSVPLFVDNLDIESDPSGSTQRHQDSLRHPG